MKKIILSLLVVTSLLLTACAGLVVGGADNSNSKDSRSASQIRSDTQITNRINSAYVKDRGIPALNISVKTYRGVVSLYGKVPSESIRKKAIAIAQATSGVSSVRSSLQVSR